VIIIAAQLDFADQQTRDTAVATSAPIQQATRDDEAGCHVYCFAADPCVPTRIQVYELWEDAPSLAAHFLHENYFNMRTMFGQHGITGAVTHKYRIDAVATVYNADRIATTDFD
jgi:quinol monooxygenase YgiN